MTLAGPRVRAAGSGASWLQAELGPGQGTWGPAVLEGLGSVPDPAWPRRGCLQAMEL